MAKITTTLECQNGVCNVMTQFKGEKSFKMVKFCEMRVEIYPHNDFNYMRCHVTFDNDRIDDFYFFGTRFDWVNKLIWLEETYPDIIFKTKFFVED